MFRKYNSLIFQEIGLNSTKFIKFRFFQFLKERYINLKSLLFSTTLFNRLFKSTKPFFFPPFFILYLLSKTFDFYQLIALRCVASRLNIVFVIEHLSKCLFNSFASRNVPLPSSFTSLEEWILQFSPLFKTTTALAKNSKHDSFLSQPQLLLK